MSPDPELPRPRKPDDPRPAPPRPGPLPPAGGIRPPRGLDAIGWLRILVWIIPGPSVLIIVLLLAQVLPPGRVWAWVTVMLGAVLFASFGVFDGILSRRLPCRDGKPLPGALAKHTALFFLTQSLVAPVVTLGVLFGMCAMGALT